MNFLSSTGLGEVIFSILSAHPLVQSKFVALYHSSILFKIDNDEFAYHAKIAEKLNTSFTLLILIQTWILL
jgi:hypothetical protein